MPTASKDPTKTPVSPIDINDKGVQASARLSEASSQQHMSNTIKDFSLLLMDSQFPLKASRDHLYRDELTMTRKRLLLNQIQGGFTRPSVAPLKVSRNLPFGQKKIRTFEPIRKQVSPKKAKLKQLLEFKDTDTSDVKTSNKIPIHSKESVSRKA